MGNNQVKIKACTHLKDLRQGFEVVLPLVAVGLLEYLGIAGLAVAAELCLLYRDVLLFFYLRP